MGENGERETGVIPGHPKPMNYSLTASSEARKPSWEAKKVFHQQYKVQMTKGTPGKCFGDNGL